MNQKGGQATKPKELAEEMFSVERSIRCVGIADPGPEYELLESRMRKDVKSLTRMKTDNEFVETVPQAILEASEKPEKGLGEIAYSVTRHKNSTLVFFKTPEYRLL